MKLYIKIKKNENEYIPEYIERAYFEFYKEGGYDYYFKKTEMRYRCKGFVMVLIYRNNRYDYKTIEWEYYCPSYSYKY